MTDIAQITLPAVSALADGQTAGELLDAWHRSEAFDMVDHDTIMKTCAILYLAASVQGCTVALTHFHSLTAALPINIARELANQLAPAIVTQAEQLSRIADVVGAGLDHIEARLEYSVPDDT